MAKFKAMSASGQYELLTNQGWSLRISRVLKPGTTKYSWSGYVFPPGKSSAELMFKGVRTKKEAEKRLLDYAYSRMIKKESIHGKVVEMTIMTPRSCDPSSELFWSM